MDIFMHVERTKVSFVTLGNKREIKAMPEFDIEVKLGTRRSEP